MWCVVWFFCDRALLRLFTCSTRSAHIFHYITRKNIPRRTMRKTTVRTLFRNTRLTSYTSHMLRRFTGTGYENYFAGFLQCGMDPLVKSPPLKIVLSASFECLSAELTRQRRFSEQSILLLSRYRWQPCLVYLDDIIFSKNKEDHLRHI